MATTVNVNAATLADVKKVYDSLANSDRSLEQFVNSLIANGLYHYEYRRQRDARLRQEDRAIKQALKANPELKAKLLQN